MKTRIWKFTFSVVFGLAIVAFLVSPVADAKSPVTRPFNISGQMTFLDGFGAPPWAILDQGVASELGNFVALSKYGMDGTEFGIYYAANGDQLFWKSGGSGRAEFAGGTGRFENATGWFTYKMSPLQFVDGPEGTTSVVIMYVSEEGSITY